MNGLFDIEFDYFLEVALRNMFVVLFAGLTVAAAFLSYHAFAQGRGEPATSQEPITTTPAPEEKSDYWTPKRLKEAEPLEMPQAPWPPDPTRETGVSEPDPSQSGTGDSGNPDVAPDEDAPQNP